VIASRRGDVPILDGRADADCVRHLSSGRLADSVRFARRITSSTGVSMADNSMTGTFQINLPKDLLTEAKRIPKVKKDELRVEGWRNSWLSRISELVVGKE
jgi:hypothetical protein